MKHILILGNAARTLVRFRGPLICELLSRGFRVTAAAGEADEEVTRTLRGWGVEFHAIQLGRTGMNPVADLKTLSQLIGLMRRVRADIFFGYTIKPVVYGLIAAWLTRVERRVGMIEGLGYAFTNGSELKRMVTRSVVTVAFRLSIPLADTLIVLNQDDAAFFRALANGRVTPALACVAGAGVELHHYTQAPLHDGPIQFLMIARLLGDKGVREFAEAARTVKRQLPAARFVLVGRIDSNPAAVTPAEVEAWTEENVIEYRGELRDVRPAIAAAHVYVLPSYREGMPRTVLEAMAMGRAIVTTDVPGCRETVVTGKNGLLVPPRDADALAAAMLQFAKDPAFVASAGAASLELCKSQFDARIVASQTAKFILGEF